VQGEGAAEEIAAAIRDFNTYREIDVMIVGRGGGSLEDLWAFNEEVVARAISRSKIPIISAVGHEVDFTIADFVADLRAPTPSAAAELVVRSKAELAAGLDAFSHRLALAMRRRLDQCRGELSGLSRALKDPSLLLGHLAQRLDDLDERARRAVRVMQLRRHERLANLHNRLRLQNPALQIEQGKERLLGCGARLENAMERVLDRSRQAAAVSAGKLQALSPLATLARGFCITRKLPEMTIVTDSRRIEPGERLELTFQRGGAFCRVESKHD
jgi:exodeoxyribonuclease VII large subunit